MHLRHPNCFPETSTSPSYARHAKPESDWRDAANTRRGGRVRNKRPEIKKALSDDAIGGWSTAQNDDECSADATGAWRLRVTRLRERLDLALSPG